MEDLDGSTWCEWFTLYDVTVEGASPCFDGWSFHSTVDYEEGSASVIFRTRRGAGDVPERFRTLGSICEHCKTKRRRSAVYLLAHEDGRVIQVGKSCLKDFLGHASPDNIAAVAELIMELGGGMGAEESLSGHAGSPDSKTYLAFVALEIRKHGWLAKSKTMDEQSSTSDAAMGRLWDHTKAAKDHCQAKTEKPSDDDRARAATALEWARGISPDSDYLHNLKAAASREGVGKNAGLIASIIPAWDDDGGHPREAGDGVRRRRWAAPPRSDAHGRQGDPDHGRRVGRLVAAHYGRRRWEQVQVEVERQDPGDGLDVCRDRDGNRPQRRQVRQADATEPLRHQARRVRGGCWRGRAGGLSITR